MRDILTLNGIWEWKLDSENKGIAEKWFEKIDPGDVTWSKIILPSASEFFEKDQRIIAKGSLWFWRQVWFSKETETRHIELCFNRLLPKAEIYLDGKSLYIHDKGDYPVVIKLPKSLPIEKPLSLIVRIFGFEERKQEDLPWSGILDDVFIKLTGALQFEFFRLQAYPKENYTKGHVDAHFDIGNYFGSDVYSQIAIRVFGNGKEVFLKLENFKPVKDTTSHLIVSFDIADPKFWTPEEPFLYDMELKLTRTNNMQDNLLVQFGIREFGFKDQTFLLNGKPYALKGIQYSPEYPYCGPLIPSALIAQDLKLMKQAGLNLLLCLNTVPEAVAVNADKLGLILIEKVTPLNMVAILKRDGAHACLWSWFTEDDVKPESLPMEFGSGVQFFQLGKEINTDELKPKIFIIEKLEQLANIQPRKLPRIILLKQNAIPGKRLGGLKPYLADSEEAQADFVNKAKEFGKLEKNLVSGVLFGDWADSIPENTSRSGYTGLVTSDRKPKLAFYALSYEK